MLARGVGVPHFFHIRYGAIEGINNILEKEGITLSKTLIVSGSKFTRTTADKLETVINGSKCREYVDGNDLASIKKVEDAIAIQEPSLVIGVGGGKVLDVTKFSCLRTDKPFIAMPTVLSNDGISSPISVIASNGQSIKSTGARPPIGIIVDLGIVKDSPRQTILAGIGDLISNLSAVDDWNLANNTTGERVDRFAEILAKNSAEGFLHYVLKSALAQHGENITNFDDKTIVSLAEGLIQSGIAMSLAGSSRPCSGSEHLISHALDQLLGFAKPHGLQVGLATLFTGLLHGREISDLLS
ncbi:MAG TPA: iron-containing alcohol dehydrogenase, partial [Ferruginibacter sp.]|nr:iron-containing alcohol dehydrogenase [Ferruginibacter sp.]